ncbi:MAG: hypothetical protein ACOYOU_07735 [Kiritimatiellia bacterium]
MKSIGGWIRAGISCLMLGAAADVAQAQGGARPAVGPAAGAAAGAAVRGAPGAASRILAIRRMPRLSKVKLPTPTYTTSATRTTTGRPREWAVFEITYDTLPEWMDEVVVTYYLMAERRGVAEAKAENKKEYTFYQTTVRYADVAKGEHTACVVLPPAVLLRNGDQFIGLAVEFTSGDGTLLAVQHETTGSLLPTDWWKKPEVTENKSVVKRDGLVDRSKTPFALINMDDYEVVK